MILKLRNTDYKVMKTANFCLLSAINFNGTHNIQIPKLNILINLLLISK